MLVTPSLVRSLRRNCKRSSTSSTDQRSSRPSDRTPSSNSVQMLPFSARPVFVEFLLYSLCLFFLVAFASVLCICAYMYLSLCPVSVSVSLDFCDAEAVRIVQTHSFKSRRRSTL